MTKSEKEGLYGEAESVKAQNIRFVITTALVALVVLGIAVWGIIYAVGGGNRGSDKKPAEETTAQVEQKEEPKTEEKTTVEAASGENTGSNVVEVTDLKEEKSAKAETEKTSETTATTAAASTTTDKNIPKTGPEGILPVALLAGAIVTFVGSVKLAKFKA